MRGEENREEREREENCRGGWRKGESESERGRTAGEKRARVENERETQVKVKRRWSS